MSAFRNTSKDKAASSKASADKELHKLRRVDLLELLIDQLKENERQAATIKELSELTDRLKAKLDTKDEQIEQLREKIEQKDLLIERLVSGIDSSDLY